jgi:hypothetical protein
MRADELTKEMIDEMSDAEVVFWCTQFGEQERAVKMRQHMLDQVEIRDAQNEPRIHVASKVIE